MTKIALFKPRQVKKDKSFKVYAISYLHNDKDKI